MLNAEKYKERIKELEYKFALCGDELKRCKSIRCDNCNFYKFDKFNGKPCNLHKIEWLLGEYKEPILTDKEKAYLKNVIEPRRDEVTVIAKNKYCANQEGEFSTIEVYVKNPWVDINKNDRTCPNYRLLDFITTEDMPFNGMSLLSYYSLEDLGL